MTDGTEKMALNRYGPGKRGGFSDMKLKTVVLFCILVLFAASYFAVKIYVNNIGPDASADLKKLASIAEGFAAEGEYEKAAGIYEEAIRSTGAVSGDIYLNLGKIYYEKGQIGKALLNFERARSYIPRDGDLLYGISKAGEKMKRKDTGPSGLFSKYTFWIGRTAAFLSVDEAFFFLFLSYLSVILYILFYKIFRKDTPYSNLVTAFLVFLFLIVSAVNFSKLYGFEEKGIVLKKITDAKYEPLDDSETNFPLYEGMRVSILRESDGWKRVQAPGGAIGWVVSDAVSSVIDGRN
ncbi:MAG: hypothetical protein GF392_03185 [Candidatus Omnitrophica bacterium]|nr:hypothetical protein [Candidatus Omnitrophota bacterium]